MLLPEEQSLLVPAFKVTVGGAALGIVGNGFPQDVIDLIRSQGRDFGAKPGIVDLLDPPTGAGDTPGTITSEMSSREQLP